MSTLLSPTVVGILFIVLIVLFFRPIKKIFKFFLHAALGFLVLYAVNTFGAGFGFYLPLNLLNCIIAGFLGIPGVLLLLAYHYLL